MSNKTEAVTVLKLSSNSQSAVTLCYSTTKQRIDSDCQHRQQDATAQVTAFSVSYRLSTVTTVFDFAVSVLTEKLYTIKHITTVGRAAV
jgi:hypothetical protein